MSPVPIKSEGAEAPSVWFLGRRDRGHSPDSGEVDRADLRPIASQIRWLGKRSRPGRDIVYVLGGTIMENASFKAAVTPEIFEQGIRLANIMMPRFMKQTIEVFQLESGQTHGRFVHYTSAEAALNIIRTKRFWMRNTNCMSDFSEVQHGFDILNSFFANKAKRESFTEALDDCITGVASEAISAFYNSWRDIRFNSYIACLSEHQDIEDSNGRLSMWRAFGGTATRIGIVLNIPYTLSILPLNIIFSSVAYLSESAAHKDLEAVIGNVRANREFLRMIGHDVLVRIVFNTFLFHVVCLKHEGFHEEREWRAIYAPTLGAYAPLPGPSQLIESSTEVISGVPQVVYKVPLDASVSDQIADLDFTQIFDHLIIGPTSYPQPIYSAFVDELTKAGVANSADRVRVSEIPIRA